LLEALEARLITVMDTVTFEQRELGGAELAKAVAQSRSALWANTSESMVILMKSLTKPNGHGKPPVVDVDAQACVLTQLRTVAGLSLAAYRKHIQPLLPELRAQLLWDPTQARKLLQGMSQEQRPQLTLDGACV
jgi:hypothetical protein